MVDDFYMVVMGPPPTTKRHNVRVVVPKSGARPFTQPYTDATTKANYKRVEEAWDVAGRPVLPEGPIRITITSYFKRPNDHYNSAGELNERGQASRYPAKKPDIDNIMKVVLDTLNGKAYKDDALMVGAELYKRWAPMGTHEHTAVHLMKAGV